MKFFLSLVFSISFLTSYSQVGIHMRYQNLDVVPWEEVSKVDGLFSNTLEFGVDYWFRLKNYRIEFMPELYFGNAKNEQAGSSYSFRNLGLAANTNFYVFDFIGDCQCPTFSKQGTFLTKGFFLSVAPLAELQFKKAGGPANEEAVENQSFHFGGSLGAGVDIGLTDLITLTPYVRYKLILNADWENLGLYVADFSQSNPYLQNNLEFGIRLGFRPDYVRSQNKYRFRR